MRIVGAFIKIVKKYNNDRTLAKIEV